MKNKSVCLPVITILCFALLAIGCKKTSTAPQVEDLTRPVIWLSVNQMDFTASEAGGDPDSQTFQVKNTGINSLEYAIKANVDWLIVEPPSGSSSGEAKEHTVSINKEGLEAQEEAYAATINVECSSSYNNPQTVTVSLTISEEPPPRILVQPKNLDYAAYKNGGDPPTQKITVKNNGEGTLKYEITSDKSWLSVSPSAGQSKGQSKTHTVSLSSGGLGLGEHTGTLTISDPNASNNPRTVDVTLKLEEGLPPQIWVNKDNLTFNASIEGGDPPDKELRIKNAGGGKLNYQISSSASWLGISPNSGNSSGQERSHTVQVVKAGLSVGTYNGTLTIRDSNASNSPYNVNVRFKITSDAPNTDNKIWPSCSPNSGSKGTTVRVSIRISGNLNEIKVFGLELHFDPQMFQYQGTSSGNLTGGWASVAGNEISSGMVRVGGFAGSASAIPVGSQGTIAVVTLRVTGDAYGNGHSSELSISDLKDDIVGMKTSKGYFTLVK